MSFPTTFPAITNLLGGLAALGCLGAVPLWILGVPGTDGNYAKGWFMGLQVLWQYPAAFLVNFVFFWVVGRFAGPGKFDWPTLGACVTVVLLVVAAARMVHAFRTMS